MRPEGLDPDSRIVADESVKPARNYENDGAWQDSAADATDWLGRTFATRDMPGESRR